MRTSSGETSSIEADLFLPDAWVGDDTGGTYRLSFIGQTTIRPITLRVVIHAPDGMAFTSASDQLTREGDDLVYEGHPRGNLDLEASFAPIATAQDLANPRGTRCRNGSGYARAGPCEGLLFGRGP